MGIEVALNPADKVTLEFLDGGKPFDGHPFPAVRAILPVALPRLVAADMDVLGREQVHDLVQHLFQKGEGRFLAGTEVFGIRRAPHTGDGIHRLPGMTGHLDLRNDRHVMFRRIGDDFTGIGLRQESAVGAVVPASSGRPFLPGIPGPPGALFRQLGVGLDFQTPAGRIRQMEVQDIELGRGQGIDLLDDEILVPEMAGDVQHGTPPGETRIVDDDPAVVRLFQLGERRPGAVHAFGRIGLDQDPFGGDGDPVGLFPGESRQLGAPLGKGPLSLHDFHFFRLGHAIGHLIRNGRRKDSQRRQ